MLRSFHRILIGSGIALGILLIVLAGVREAAYGDASFRVAGAIGGAASVVLGIYLRWFLRK